ncbi:MAG: pilus (MSHA type) biogenesis protein MshL [Burkholderiales bacterium PBB3]|nr:MAG: pilus (MSHA type) biogenesis protein MshL [Burkholderiales bacterium PBB3]
MTACAAPPAPPVSKSHIQVAPAVAGTAPDFASAPPMPPRPRATPKQEVYSVVMQNVNVQDLLFALARDAKVNVDIHPSISGTVTMNVRDQTLTEILDRVARQVDLRYELQGNSLSILPDVPYLKNYRVDYPNIQRNSAISINTSTNVASTGAAPGSAGGGTGSNSSTSEIVSKSNNNFWDTLVNNVRDMLRETDKVLPGAAAGASPSAGAAASPGASAAAGTGNASSAASAAANAAAASVAGRTIFREAASVMSNAEAGYISVRATQSQHQKVQEFIDRVMRSARRQVLIEATIVEVDLSNRYQQGIDWSLIKPGGTAYDSSFSIRPAGPSSGLQTGGLISTLTSLTLNGPSVFKGYDLTGMLSMLESFGTLRVLSSPKISVLNNQSSVLKVVDNKVYFTLAVTPGTAASAGVAATPAVYNTVINTVPIGLLMSVTPQISESGEVILNLRPTISRITGYASDPSPALTLSGVSNRIPEVQTREMESVLRVQSGGVAILGGLMQDSRNNNSDEVPILNRLPGLGNLFKYRDEASKKTELVIFLRPTVLQDASLEGDFKGYRNVIQEAREAMDVPSQPTRPEFQLQ